MIDILLITPPFTQLNTPYPATAYLKGFLNTKSISSFEVDLGLEVILEIYSQNGLQKIFDFAEKEVQKASLNAQRIFGQREHYEQVINDVVLYLQGQNPSLTRNVCSDNFLPTANRFNNINYQDWAFGSMGLVDKAKHLCTLFLEDISDFIVECVDADFGVSKYAEQLGQSANHFDELQKRMDTKPSHVDEITLKLLSQIIKEHQPKLVCFSVPFPGNLASAFRCAQMVKKEHKNIFTVFGGGFANTELRSVNDVRVFNYMDFICLDDGETPLEIIHNYVVKNTLHKKEELVLKRTFTLQNGLVIYNNLSLQSDYKQDALGTPDYADLNLNKYISVIEVANPMHSLWNDGRWLKLTMAHGCYWGKCTFCDISLDYIKNYQPVAAAKLVDRMEEMMAKTGERGFHFVDEAAPPALMRDVAIEIIRRKLVVTWWTNIRFEKHFTADLCRLLQASGCVAVSGGLEVASNRLLKLIDKGVSVEQVAQVTHNFTSSGILVHAYLMYGYPSQTIQETVDSLEMVRQLFELGIIQSGFWHQFSLTAHSPVGLNPEKYDVTPIVKKITFAHNDIGFKDKTGIDHDQFREGLNKSLYNFMHGICFDYDLQDWFEFKIPKTTIKQNHIQQALEANSDSTLKFTAKLLYIGAKPIISKTSKGLLTLTFHGKHESIEIEVETNLGRWIINFLDTISVHHGKTITLTEAKASYELQFSDFETFWYSQEAFVLREMGLVS